MAARRAASFRDLTRQAILDGVTQNMITPIELIKAVIDGMAERGFGRIVNITSLSVYVPIPGLDVSSGARAGLTSFLAGVARTVAERNVTINNLLPGKLDTDRLRGGFPEGRRRGGVKAGSPPTFRPGVWAPPRSSARSAPSSAPSTPAISPARTFRSTAGSTPAHSDAAACDDAIDSSLEQARQNAIGG